jgi:hypothetical protein
MGDRRAIARDPQARASSSRCASRDGGQAKIVLDETLIRSREAGRWCGAINSFRKTPRADFGAERFETLSQIGGRDSEVSRDHDRPRVARNRSVQERISFALTPHLEPLSDHPFFLLDRNDEVTRVMFLDGQQNRNRFDFMNVQRNPPNVNATFVIYPPPNVTFIGPGKTSIAPATCP